VSLVRSRKDNERLAQQVALLKAKSEDAAGTSASSPSGDSAAVTVLSEELERCKAMRDAAALVAVFHSVALRLVFTRVPCFALLYVRRFCCQQVLTLKSRVEELEEEIRAKPDIDTSAIHDKVVTSWRYTLRIRVMC
jgi:cell division septum initiation protein DivIVA